MIFHIETLMLISVSLNEIYSALPGGPCVFITSRSADGVDNAMANAWNMLHGMAPAVVTASLMTDHTTTKNILATGVFGISVPGTSLQKKLLASGCCHGWEVGDKFVKCGLEKLEGEALPVPLVGGALAHLECRLTEPDLLARTGILVGEPVAARVDERYWENGLFTCEGRPESTMHSAGEFAFFTRGPVRGW